MSSTSPSQLQAAPAARIRTRPVTGIITAAAVVVVVFGAAVVGPLLAADGSRTVAPGYSPPDADLLLGTDALGRDVFARVLAGGSGLLLIAAIATLVAVVCGVVLGLLTSRRTVTGAIVAWVLDVVLVVPAMVTLLVLIFGLGAGALTMTIITSAVSAPFIARFTRSLVRPLLASDYVLFARAGGDSWPRVFVAEIGPVIAGPLTADAGARFVGALYLVASASFLGFDPLGSQSDWASMVQSGLGGIALNPWASLAPALAIASVTIPANLLLDRVVRRSTS